MTRLILAFHIGVSHNHDEFEWRNSFRGKTLFLISKSILTSIMPRSKRIYLGRRRFPSVFANGLKIYIQDLIGRTIDIISSECLNLPCLTQKK